MIDFYRPYRAGLCFKSFTFAADILVEQCGLELRLIKALWQLDVEEIETVVGPPYRQSRKGIFQRRKSLEEEKSLRREGSRVEWHAKVACES